MSYILITSYGIISSQTSYLNNYITYIRAARIILPNEFLYLEKYILGFCWLFIAVWMIYYVEISCFLRLITLLN